MRVARLEINNFRGVAKGVIELGRHNLLVGVNSVGKSTVCEALDLVLGAERMFRRPVVDEHDFHCGNHLPDQEGNLPEIRVEVVLTDLSEEARRRFGFNLELWDDQSQSWVAPPADTRGVADDQWRLRLVFVGRYNPDEDDFDGGTYFAHPERLIDDFGRERTGPSAGLVPFTREDKRLCGFLYLRVNRTGTRALSFGRGSLLDTITRLEAERTGETKPPLWAETLEAVTNIDLSEGTGLLRVLDEVTIRARRFVNLSDDRSVRAELSDLTREHLREVLRVFVSTRPGTHPVPLTRLSTGTVNLLVFALLTYVAELRGNDSVIFAMEEPEIALPPHAQRRLVAYVRTNMAQAIVTSHSPYILDQFAPDDIVVLRRDTHSVLTGHPLTLPATFSGKRYKQERRQFAEAVLAQAVAVVEGATELAVFQASAVSLASLDPDYVDPDLDGITFYNAGSDTAVPTYAPIFAGLGKRVYGWHDKLKEPLSPDQAAVAAQFHVYTAHQYDGMEDLLCAEMRVAVLRRFADTVATRPDYPTQCGVAPAGQGSDLVDHVRSVLIARKATHVPYGALLIAEATSVDELPATVVAFLRDIHADVEAAFGPALAESPTTSSTPGNTAPSDDGDTKDDDAEPDAVSDGGQAKAPESGTGVATPEETAQ